MHSQTSLANSPQQLRKAGNEWQVMVWPTLLRWGQANDGVSEHFAANHRQIMAPWGFCSTSEVAPEASREERNVEMWKSHSILVFPAALNGEEHNIKTH